MNSSAFNPSMRIEPIVLSDESSVIADEFPVPRGFAVYLGAMTRSPEVRAASAMRPS